MSDEPGDLLSELLSAPDDVDELFGDGEGVPTPRTGAILGLLLGGLAVAVAGLACTAVPGGVLVLLGWMLVEKEMDRIDSGYLPDAARRPVARLKLVAYGAVGLIIALFLLQAYLFCSGAYDALWGSLLELTIDTIGVPPDPAGPPAPAPAPAPPPAPAVPPAP